MRFTFIVFCFLFFNCYCCLNNIILGKEINKIHTSKSSELIIPISIPFANKLIDINAMPFRECTFGYVYHSKSTNNVYLITSLFRYNNNSIIKLYKEEYKHIC